VVLEKVAHLCRHTAAIEVVYYQSPIRCSPIFYQIGSSGSESTYPSSQKILFGCPLELSTDGGVNKIPPILKGLLDSVKYTDYWKGLSEFGLSGKYFIIHARRPQAQFHFSSRVPGLAGYFSMPSVDTLSPLISVSSSCFALSL
jgi:hypothetical protein